MNNRTLSYSPANEGWPSFYSFDPEFMIGMNQRFYSFKGGALYRHNEGGRNTFYGSVFPSKIRTVFNQSPLENKVFKTIALESTTSWSIDVFTELETGDISGNDFDRKEDTWFAFLRNKESGLISDERLLLRSAQGLGVVSDIETNGGGNAVLKFDFGFDSIISVGDSVWYENPLGPFVNIGSVESINRKDREITLTLPPTLGSSGRYLFYVKNGISESNGVRGSYMVVDLETTSNNTEEIFAIKSNIFKSYP
jgi:hypothetical protein